MFGLESINNKYIEMLGLVVILMKSRINKRILFGSTSFYGRDDEVQRVLIQGGGGNHQDC